MINKRTISVKGTQITIIEFNKDDYISLTDMTRSFGDDTIIKNWLRNRNTVEFLGIWEQLNNSNFNLVEFDQIRSQPGLNSFVLSAKKWIENTNAIGLIASAGRYGGTYAHKDIAFEFGSWLSPEFKLYLLKEFQRLKDDESNRLSLEWNLHRTLSKINYRIHTDAVKDFMIPPEVTNEQAALIYASEADLINVAMFGKTASQWRIENSRKKGNIRDYSTIEQLLVLANLESLNAEFIRMHLPQSERLLRLNQSAIVQMKSLSNVSHFKFLKKTKKKL